MGSLPPYGVTWPMVAYAFVREMPALAMVAVGGIVAIVLLQHNAGSFEAIASALLPAVIAALSRSQPADAWKESNSTSKAPELGGLSGLRGP